MLDFESCQSLEKLVIDNEICGMALRLARGIEQRDEDLALPLFEGFSAGTQFLTMAHTRRWYREEHIFPDIIDRETYDAWVSGGKKDSAQRAGARVEEILQQASPNLVDAELQDRLRAIMLADAQNNGIDTLPPLG
jgi:trimethylamine--corrinoid protein Co-methyltransferase